MFSQKTYISYQSSYFLGQSNCMNAANSTQPKTHTYTHTHTFTHKHFPRDVSIIPHGLHCTPPSVPHILTPHPLLTLLGVAMALPQLLWYPGYGDTVCILIGCQLCKGGHTKKGRDGRGEKKEKRVILVVKWMAEAAQLQAEQRAPF